MSGAALVKHSGAGEDCEADARQRTIASPNIGSAVARMALPAHSIKRRRDDPSGISISIATEAAIPAWSSMVAMVFGGGPPLKLREIRVAAVAIRRMAPSRTHLAISERTASNKAASGARLLACSIAGAIGTTLERTLVFSSLEPLFGPNSPERTRR